MQKVLLDYDQLSGLIYFDGTFIGTWLGIPEHVEPAIEVTNNTQSSSQSSIGVDAILKLREKKMSLNDIYQLRAANLI